MSAHTYRIPTQFLSELSEKVAKINKKASKLGTDLVTVRNVGEIERVEVSVGGRIGKATMGRLVYDVQPIEVIGNAPVINGWEFVAVIRHDRQGNSFEVLPGVQGEMDLTEYKYRAKVCDHCHQNRVRNATYLLRSTDTGDLMQVGSTCLGDFTGYSDPQAAARACENIFKLFRQVESYCRVVPRTTKVFFLEEWMAWVAQTIRQEGGYTSRASAGWNSTADLSKIKAVAYANGDDVEAPTDGDFDKARQVIAWVRDLEPEGEFMESLKASMAADDDLRETDMGRSAYAFKAMWKDQAEQAKKLTQVSQGFLGNVKDKLTLDLTVERTGGYESAYGWTHIYNFTDGVNKLVWFASKNQQWKVGDKVKLTGTVKEHRVDSYTGDKQTVITRCKAVS